ncbi:hypothetical protein [Kitasatospora mediocidica]|uniref:hypothetical protein n=1 Tax=Kitasatospora mediocidica TaxID=58352 RepID=UPI000691FF6A|nr:hypothetical protein [Kitasatospora mediocidica]
MWRAAFSMDDPDSLHLQELALFLSVHLDRGPGVLWPEHDHPALAAASPPDGAARLAADLGRWTGLPARTGIGLTGDGQQAAPAHLVIHQTSGAGVWHLRRGHGEAAESFRYRLRSGEVLYIPPRWAYRAELTPDARFIATLLDSADQPPHEVSPQTPA